MKKRKYHICALIVVVCALLLRFTALQTINQSLSMRVKAVVMKSETEKTQEIERADELSRAGKNLSLLALAAGVAGLVLCFASIKAKEPGSRVVLYGLMIVFVLSGFILI
jgi:hypothetical protein